MTGSEGASILVTGGTGSFGRGSRGFARVVVLAKYYPRRLVILSRDELKRMRCVRGSPGTQSNSRACS